MSNIVPQAYLKARRYASENSKPLETLVCDTYLAGYCKALRVVADYVRKQSCKRGLTAAEEDILQFIRQEKGE